MGLEAATYIHQLNPLNPVGAVDPKAQGDDHIRMIKSAVQASFPNIAGAMTATHLVLNQWGGLTAAYNWSGQHRHIDGTAAVPAFSFANDINSGIYRVGTDTVGVSVNGANTFEIGVFGTAIRVGSLYILDGTAGNPSIRFDADTNTGIYRPANDVLTIAAGGAPVASFRNDSYDGITLEAGCNFYSSDGTVALPAFSFVNDTNSGIFRVGADELGISVGGVRVAHIVGPAVSVMSVRIDSGQFGVTDGSNTAPAYAFTLDPNTGFYRVGTDIFAATAGGVQAMQWWNNGGIGMALFSDGSAAIPGLAFGSDVNTGFYKIGSDALGFTEGGSGFRIGFRNVPRSTTVTTLAIGDNGKCVAVTASINIPASVFSAGDCISIYNDSAASVNITISAGTLRLAGTTTTGTRSIAPRGMATLWFNVGGVTPEVIVSGAGVG